MSERNDGLIPPNARASKAAAARGPLSGPTPGVTGNAAYGLAVDSARGNAGKQALCELDEAGFRAI